MDTWIRYFHVVLNVLFILVGLLLAGFGIYVLLAAPTQELFMYYSGNQIMIYATIAIGGVVFLVGACGALGSCYQNKCLLITYLILNILFLLAQLGIVIFVVVEKDSMENHLETVWGKLNNETVDLLQDRFKCCGYKSETEWNGSYPDSCYNTTNPERETREIWSQTCYDSILEYFDENIILAGSIAGLVFLLEAFQIIITGVLIRHINDKITYRHSATLSNNNEEFDSEGAFDEYMKNVAYQESRH